MAILKRTLAFSAAAAISALSITAVSAENTVVKGNINKPYANITVKGEGAENLSYTLTNSNGEKVASWKGLCDNVTVSSGNVCKITKDEPGYSFINNNKLYNTYDNSDMLKDVNDNSFKTYSLTVDGKTKGFSYENPSVSLEVGKVNTLNLEKYKLPTETEFTIPAGKYQFFADQGVLAKQYNVGFNLTARDDEHPYANHNFTSAKSELLDLKSQYSVERLSVEGSGESVTNIYNSYVRKYDEEVGYAKVKVKLSDLHGFTEDGKIKSDAREGEPTYGKTYDLGETDPAVCRSLLLIMSGGAIQAVTPDKDGYVEFYVNTKDYFVGYHYKVYDPNDKGNTTDMTGYTMYKDDFLPVETVTKTVDTTLDIPDSGVTLYNLAPDTYTVSVDDAEYTLENNTFTVTDTADLQKFAPTLPTEPSSSEDENSSDTDNSSEDENSSDADVSSEDENSSDIDISSEDENSSDIDVSSEEESSSDADVSSKEESTSDSDVSSKEESASNDESTVSDNSNPVTGTAAGLSITSTVLAAIALIVSKKRK